MKRALGTERDRFIIEVCQLAATWDCEVELEFSHGEEDTGRLAVTSATEDEDQLVGFINRGPAHWDYELTTSDYTGVPVVYVGLN